MAQNKSPIDEIEEYIRSSTPLGCDNFSLWDEKDQEREYEKQDKALMHIQELQRKLDMAVEALEAWEMYDNEGDTSTVSFVILYDKALQLTAEALAQINDDNDK